MAIGPVQLIVVGFKHPDFHVRSSMRDAAAEINGRPHPAWGYRGGTGG